AKAVSSFEFPVSSWARLKHEIRNLKLLRQTRPHHRAHPATALPPAWRARSARAHRGDGKGVSSFEFQVSSCRDCFRLKLETRNLKLRAPRARSAPQSPPAAATRRAAAPARAAPGHQSS